MLNANDIARIADTFNAANAAYNDALAPLTVNVVTRWASEDMPHSRHLVHRNGYHAANFEFCDPPAGWGQYKAVAVGMKADVDRFRVAKQARETAAANLRAALRA